jgi:hypothetical protein
LVEGTSLVRGETASAKTPDAQARLQRQIDAADRQIDRLVYDLYGLTEEEIKIVEGGL